MKVNYLNPILESTNEVFKTMLQLNTEQEEMEINEQMITSNEVNVIIALTGDIEGSIIYSFSKTVALNIVNEMVGMEINEIDKFVTSAIGEIANIISGKAATGLAEKDYKCDIAPPQTVVGKEVKISTGAEDILKIPIHTELGDFQVNFSLVNENK